MGDRPVSDLPDLAETAARADEAISALDLLAPRRPFSVGKPYEPVTPRLVRVLSAAPPREDDDFQQYLAAFPRAEHEFVAAQFERSTHRLVDLARGEPAVALETDWQRRKPDFVHVTLSEPVLDRARTAMLVWCVFSSYEPATASRIDDTRVALLVHRKKGWMPAALPQPVLAAIRNFGWLPIVPGGG